MFKVLRYAWKHKFPERHSALTYWEEGLPSRIDLGKSKYGGPFTVEQVEDVKTLGRILSVLLASLVTDWWHCRVPWGISHVRSPGFGRDIFYPFVHGHKIHFLHICRVSSGV